MDNRSIAAFIETNGTRMNSVNMFCSVKAQAKKNAPTLNILQEKVGGSGEGGGSQKKLLTASNRDEWQAHGLRVHVTCQKP